MNSKGEKLLETKKSCHYPKVVFISDKFVRLLGCYKPEYIKFEDGILRTYYKSNYDSAEYFYLTNKRKKSKSSNLY